MHQIISKEISMTSRDIAELVGSRHDSVKRTIETLYGKGVIAQPQPVSEQSPDSMGRMRATEVYVFSGNKGKRDSLIVVAQLYPEFTAKIVDRWQELEEQASTGLIAMPNFSNPAEAARAWAAQYEARQLAEQTKAQIGHRREATAMNTASQAVKKANKLEIELDRSKDYATVKRMQMIHHGQPFNWRVLKSTAAEMEIPPIDVFDQNYGTVKAYHADVWREAYAVEIEFTEPAANQQTQEAA
jgi:phage regulator Rha-like protein